jgi:hypothetical protein
MGLSHGTGYLRGSTRRRMTQEEIDRATEAQQLDIAKALMMPPGSAMDALLPPGHSRTPDIGGAYLDRPSRPLLGPSGQGIAPQGIAPISRTPNVNATTRPLLGNVIQAPGYAVPPMGLRPRGPSAPAPIAPQAMPEMWNPEPTPVESRGYPALSQSPIGLLQQQVDEEDDSENDSDEQKDEKSSPWSLALLSAGLGILANNYGHYGQAGPAIGKGAMQGLKTYIDERDKQDKRKRQSEEDVYKKAQQDAYMQQLAMQNRKLQSQDQQDIRNEAMYRTVNELPDGPQRDMLLEEIAIRQGGASNVIKSREERNKQRGKMIQDQTATDALAIAGNDPIKQAWARSDPKKFIEEMGSLETEVKKRAAGAVRINNNLGEKALNDASMKDLVVEQDRNRNRINALSSLDDAVNVVEQGIYTGSGAEIKKGSAKILGTLFGADTDKAARTEEFVSHIGNVVIPALQKLGGPDSDKDVQYLKNVLAGDITLEENAIKSILSKTRRRIIQEMESHSRNINEVGKDMTLPGNMRNTETLEQRKRRQRQEFGF